MKHPALLSLIALLALAACDAAGPSDHPSPFQTGPALTSWHSALAGPSGDLHFGPVPIPEGASLSATLHAGRDDSYRSASSLPGEAAAVSGQPPATMPASISLVATKTGGAYEVRLEGDAAIVSGEGAPLPEPVYVPQGDHRLLSLPGAGEPALLVTQGPRSVHFARDGDGNTIVVFDFARDGARLIGSGRAVSHLGFRLASDAARHSWDGLEVLAPVALDVSSWNGGLAHERPRVRLVPGPAGESRRKRQRGRRRG